VAYHGFMSPSTAKDWTADRARALPGDGKRHEVLDGELAVTRSPSWGHQYVALAFHRVLDAYARRHGLGLALVAPAEVEFSPQRLLEPDLFVVRLVDGRPPSCFEEVRHLILALEVVSPSTARRDRITKRQIYLSESVDEYWIVDSGSRTVERWRQGDERPEIVDRVLSWQPRADVPSLDLDLAALFAEALDGT
jgi:Uma2 family endonuclease